MKNKAVLFFLVLVLVSLACNAPAGTSQPSEVESAQATETTVPQATNTSVSPPTPTLLPPDITFTIDCSALDASFQPACDEYILTTHETVYPILRELTGVSLSSCYSNINYTILSDDPATGAGGLSNGPEITYSKTYSVELQHRMDVHELIHTIASCNGALDLHIFHGMLQNTVYDRLHILDAGYFEKRANAVDLNEYLFEQVKTSGGEDLYNQCRGILGNHMTIAYFDIEEGAVTSLYQATINPQPVNQPNEQLKFIWGDTYAMQVQSLLEKLEQDYKYVIDVPECGY